MLFGRGRKRKTDHGDTEARRKYPFSGGCPDRMFLELGSSVREAVKARAMTDARRPRGEWLAPR